VRPVHHFEDPPYVVVGDFFKVEIRSGIDENPAWLFALEWILKSMPSVGEIEAIAKTGSPAPSLCESQGIILAAVGNLDLLDFTPGVRFGPSCNAAGRSRYRAFGSFGFSFRTRV
jgi:hypothetical protein